MLRTDNAQYTARMQLHSLALPMIRILPRPVRARCHREPRFVRTARLRHAGRGDPGANAPRLRQDGLPHQPSAARVSRRGASYRSALTFTQRWSPTPALSSCEWHAFGMTRGRAGVGVARQSISRQGGITRCIAWMPAAASILWRHCMSENSA
jgi:hypothetical protein